jgi:hypothetical protein
MKNFFNAIIRFVNEVINDPTVPQSGKVYTLSELKKFPYLQDTCFYYNEDGEQKEMELHAEQLSKIILLKGTQSTWQCQWVDLYDLHVFTEVSSK